MVTLVNVLVERTPVERAVGPVVEHVLEHKEKGNLRGHEPRRGEGNLISRHAKVAADRVEEPDERGLAGKVGNEDHLGHLPHLRRGDLLVRLELPLVEERNLVNDQPWEAATKVDDLRSELYSLHLTSCSTKDIRPVARMALPM